MAAADSNVLLRLLVRDDEAQHQAARAFLRTAGRVFVADNELPLGTFDARLSRLDGTRKLGARARTASR
jgi:hypothetical protein